MRYRILVGAILFATLIRLYQIDLQSIWFDEGWSAHAAIQPSFVAAFNTDQTNPPLYYVLLYLTSHGLGDSAFSLRIISLFFSLLLIPLGDLLGRFLFNPRAGIIAALLVSCSAPLWWAAQEARMYTLLAVFILLLALAWHRILTHPSRHRWWWLLWVAELLVLYTHNTGPAVVLWLNAATFLAWFAQRSPPLIRWLGGQLVVGLLWLPWFATRFLEVQAANSALNRAPILDFALLAQIWQAFWVAPWEMVGHENILIGFALLALALTLLLIPWRQPAARWLVMHTVLLIMGLLVGLTLIGNGLHGRYLVMIVPLLLVAIAAGVARIPTNVLRTGVVGIFAMGLLVNVALAQNPDYQHDDVRSMAQYYATQLTAEDVVLAWSYADRYDLAYYWRKFDIPAQRVTLPEGSDLDAIIPLLPQTGRVAQNVWYTQRADFRGMLGCVLQNGTINLPEDFTVYGMSNRLIEIPSLAIPERRVLDRPVLYESIPVATITQVGELPLWSTDRTLCIPIELRLNQAMPGNLQARVMLQNRLGWEVASTSVIFATANQQTTADLDAGEMVTAYALLRLPYGAPPGSYRVQIRIFDDSLAPSGYDMVADDGHIIGKDLPLGTWRTRSGAEWAQTNRKSELPPLDEPFNVDHLTMLAHDFDPTGTLQPGLLLKVKLLWQGTAPLPDLTLITDDGSWQMTIPPLPALRDDYSLDWRSAQIPADVVPGTVHLQLPDGSKLGSWDIEGIPFVTDEPDYAVPVGLAIADNATLVGYTVESDTINTSHSLPITLVWQAGPQPTDVSYTVFVQLLNEQGQLVAQSDALPASGERPTTGWRAGEYIVDLHGLRFNEQATPGEARLIVGWYDANTGKRVSVNSSGVDFIELPGVVTVR